MTHQIPPHWAEEAKANYEALIDDYKNRLNKIHNDPFKDLRGNLLYGLQQYKSLFSETELQRREETIFSCTSLEEFRDKYILKRIGSL